MFLKNNFFLISFKLKQKKKIKEKKWIEFTNLCLTLGYPDINKKKICVIRDIFLI